MNKSGKNLTDLLDLNRSEVLHYLIRHPGCSRAELGVSTGLTLPSISKTIRSLIECGVVYETGYSEGKKGRRSVGLSFHYEKYKILGIRLSWKKLEVRTFDFLGKAYGDIFTVSFDNISADNIAGVVSLISEKISYFCEKYPEIVSIGVAVPGPYYRDTGTVLLPPYHPDPKQRLYYPLKESIEKCTDLPVFMEHDADAGALAYWWENFAEKPDAAVMNIFADEGVGIGLIDHGKVFTGTSNCSCELGHMTINYKGRHCDRCGGNGCINAYCSAQSLTQIAKEMLPSYPDSMLSANVEATDTTNNAESSELTFHDILMATYHRDPFASKLISDCGQYLGYAISSLLHVFNPEIIVISGAVSQAGSQLMTGVQQALKEIPSNYTVVPEIRLNTVSHNLTLLGASIFAMNSMLDEPTHYFKLPINN